MKKVSYVSLLLILVGFTSTIRAQETPEGEDNGYNKWSTRNIHESDIMYRQEIWRRLDGKEPMNQPYFAFNNEITKLIIEAVKAGTLKAYWNDSLNKEMTIEDFNKKLIMPGQDNPADAAPVEDNSGWGAAAPAGGAKTAVVDNTFYAKDINILILKEDLIFDKKRSRMYTDILAISMIVPGESVATGLDVTVGAFAYKDLVALFRSKPKEAFWNNRKNSREHKNYADAFDLRLFHARIIKVSNPGNNYIEDLYDNKRNALLASEQIEADLMEYEHNLWEF